MELLVLFSVVLVAYCGWLTIIDEMRGCRAWKEVVPMNRCRPSRASVRVALFRASGRVEGMTESMKQRGRSKKYVTVCVVFLLAGMVGAGQSDGRGRDNDIREIAASASLKLEGPKGTLLNDSILPVSYVTNRVPVLSVSPKPAHSSSGRPISKPSLLTPPDSATINGIALYEDNCTTCHANLINSSKRGASAATIQARMAAPPFAQRILSGAEVVAISNALN